MSKILVELLSTVSTSEHRKFMEVKSRLNDLSKIPSSVEVKAELLFLFGPLMIHSFLATYTHELMKKLGK